MIVKLKIKHQTRKILTLVQYLIFLNLAQTGLTGHVERGGIISLIIIFFFFSDSLNCFHQLFLLNILAKDHRLNIYIF